MVTSGIGWNEIMQRLMDLNLLPVRQVEDPGEDSGEIFTTQIASGVQKFLPQLPPGDRQPHERRRPANWNAPTR